MSRISNPRRIKPEDYEKEYHGLISTLAGNLNTFMDEVVDSMNGRIDFENVRREIVQIDITVDANGVPKLNSTVRFSYSSIWGVNVINSQNLTNPALFPESSPSIHYSANGTTAYTINKINGLQADNKYRLTLEVIAR